MLIDDFIVRGTTSIKIVQMMRDAGAKEVHFRISSPPITHPDYYGIDTPDATSCWPRPTTSKACASSSARIRSPSCRSTASTSAMGHEERDPARPQFTDHCFTGDYPTPLTDQTGQQHQPRQLSLLAEAG